MRNSTKLKKLVQMNTLTIEWRNDRFEIVVTNIASGNSHVCIGENFTKVMEAAYKDTLFYSKNKDLNF